MSGRVYRKGLGIEYPGRLRLTQAVYSQLDNKNKYKTDSESFPGHIRMIIDSILNSKIQLQNRRKWWYSTVQARGLSAQDEPQT